MRQAVHVQGGVVTGCRKHIGIMLGVLETAVKAVDGGHQSAGHGVQVAALASGKVHSGRERGGGLLRVQTGAGKVQRGGGGVFHAEGGVGRRVLHGLVQQLGLFLAVAHRLVGELHGLIDLGKARHARRADGDQRQGDLLRQLIADRGDLLAYLLHLLRHGQYLLLGDGSEALILIFEAFQLVFSLDDFPLEGVVLLGRQRILLD